MSRAARLLGATLAIASLSVLVSVAIPASAANFPSGGGSLALTAGTAKGLKRAHIKVSSQRFNLTYSSAIIDMTTGQASGLSANGTLTFKAKKKSVKISGFKIDGNTLTASAGSKKLSFPLQIPTGGVSDLAGNTAVNVTGVIVKTTRANAAILNKALSGKGRKGKKVKVFKAGTLGTLSYSGQNRELIEISGNATLYNNPAYFDKQTANGIAVSPIAPAMPVGPTPAHPRGGLNFPAAPGGVLQTSTGAGSLGISGGLRNTKGAQSISFTNPIFQLGASPSLTATTPVGNGQVATVDLSTLTGRSLAITPSGATLVLTNATVRLNALTAFALNQTFCTPASSCPAGTFNAGEAIGVADLSFGFR